MPLQSKLLLPALSVLFMLFQFRAHCQTSYEATVEQSRAEKNAELRGKKTSPLQNADRKHFENLDYYPVDEQWKLRANFKRAESGEVIEMPTSAGITKKYKAHGVLEFNIGGESFTLIAYNRIWPEGRAPQNYHPSLFVPFKDLTTGDETYGGGRYMDIEIPQGDSVSVELDFNLCYNPYCAYGGGFACPIPPASNFLETRVTAGEKAYPGTH